MIRDNALGLIRDNGQGHEEYQDNMQAVSAMADDIRDAVVDYQVGGYNAYVTAVSPRSEYHDRWPCSG